MRRRREKLKINFSFCPLPCIHECVVGGEAKKLQSPIKQFFSIELLYLCKYGIEINENKFCFHTEVQLQVLIIAYQSSTLPQSLDGNISLLQTKNERGIFSFGILNTYIQDSISCFNLPNNNVSAVNLAWTYQEMQTSSLEIGTWSAFPDASFPDSRHSPNSRALLESWNPGFQDPEIITYP